MARIIGIDPGSRKTGIGIIDYESKTRKIHLVFAKILRLDLETDLGQRLGELARRLQELILEYQPNQAVLEDVFAGEHARSALILGQARGAVLATLGLCKVPAQDVAAKKAKQALTGTGQASKEQVAKMVQVLLALDRKPAEDAADALALALTAVLGSSEVMARPKIRGAKNKREALRQIAISQGIIKS